MFFDLFYTVRHSTEGSEADSQQYVRMSRVHVLTILCQAPGGAGHWTRKRCKNLRWFYPDPQFKCCSFFILERERAVKGLKKKLVGVILAINFLPSDDAGYQ